jgi:hypothetical protein
VEARKANHKSVSARTQEKHFLRKEHMREKCFMNIQTFLRDKTILLCLMFFALAFSVSLYVSVAYLKPLGADIVFHLDVVDAYLRGENGMFAAHVMEINHMPYPPLFHLMLLSWQALGLHFIFIRAIQAFLYPSCLLFILLIIYKFGDKNQVFFAGLALLGSMAYVDAVLQIRPESFDVLLWLILVYATLTNKGKLGIASAVLGIYNHSFGSLALSGGALLFKHRWKQILAVAVLGAPIIIITFMYIPSMFGKWLGLYASPQAREFQNNFLSFSFTYLGALFAGLPIAVYEAFKWRTLTPLHKVALLTVASALVMIPIWRDRYYAYVSIPLAVLVSGFCASKANRWLRLFVAVYVMMFFALTYASLWVSNLYGYWDFH